MRINNTKVPLTVTLLLLQVLTFAQPCYIRLTDASGVNTDTYQPMLEAAACSLRAVFPSEFQQSFKVYDVGFYLHNTVTSGYPQIFEMAKTDVAAQSPYYLLFGKQTDKNGVYTKFWVDLKLPNTGKFGCIDLLSPTLRSDIKKKVEHVTVMTYAQNENLFFQYARAEKAAMAALQKIVADFVECCDLQARNSESTSACNAFLFPALLNEVTFSGEHYIEMKRDGDTDFGQPFPKPHYLSTRPNNGQSPLAHVSGFNVLALAKFSGNEKYATIKVRGKGETQVSGVTITVNFDEQTAIQDDGTKQITANMTGSLPYMAVFLDDFKIKWEMKVKKTGEPESDWSPVGESINDWYLTLRQPIAEEGGKGYLHFHTLFDISCRYGLGTSDIELINGVWGHFAGRQVKRADSQAMKYYGQWSGGNLATNTSELLQRKDGMCMAWTRLLLDVLKAHGFREGNNAVFVKPKSSDRMFVKTWKKNIALGTSGNVNYPFKNIEGEPLYTNNSYNWSYSEVVLTAPSKSQNNDTPQSDFGNHIFARIKGKLYDPSYGVEYGTTKVVPNPSDPLEMIELVTELDDLYISAYSLLNGQTHFIQINSVNTGDFIVIIDYLTQSH